MQRHGASQSGSTRRIPKLTHLLSVATILFSLFVSGQAFANYPCDWGTPGGYAVVDSLCGVDIGSPSVDPRYWGISTIGASKYEIHWGTGCSWYHGDPAITCATYGHPECQLDQEPPSVWVSSGGSCTDYCIFWSKQSTWMCPGTSTPPPVYGAPPDAAAGSGSSGGDAPSGGDPNSGDPGGGGTGGPSGGGTGCNNTGPSVSSTAGDPVDLATGYFIYSKQDLYVPGVIPISVSRYYRAGTPNLGAFGMSTYFQYDWWLESTQDSMLLIKPGNYQYSFFKYSDGTYRNNIDPAVRGAVGSVNTDNSKTLRMNDGSTYTFDANSRLIKVADGKGNSLTIERRPTAEGGFLTKITTQEGRYITFNATLTGTFYRIDSISDSTGRTVSYTYETDPFSVYPRLKMVTYPDGSSIQYNYDSMGRMSELINEKGVREVLNEYDTESRVIRQTHADGGVFTFAYPLGVGNIPQTSMVKPNGATTTWSFNNAFYITAVTNPDGTTTYEREPGTNKILSVTDALGRKISYTYDAKGRVLTKTDNGGNRTSYEYEDTFSKMTKITDAMGNITLMTYDASGNLSSHAAPDNKTTTFTYNLLGKPLTVTDPAGNVTTMTYDVMGNLTSVTDPLGNTSSMIYDSLGRLITSTDAKGNSTSNTYDSMGRLLTVTDPLGNVTTYAYDVTGKLSQVTDAKGQIIKYEYDSRNRLVKMTDQLNQIETYTYDTSDNLVSMTDRKGQISSYTYDQMKRLTRVDYADGSYTTYAYDTMGKVLTITDSVSGTVSYTYTGTGCGSGCTMVPDKVASETTPQGSVSYTYDAIGRRTGMTVTGQNAVSYGYDAGGRLNGIDTVINGSSAHFGIAFDNLGRRSSITFPNGVTTSYGYDNGSHLLNLQHKDPASQVLESLTYVYDQTGDRTSMDRQNVNLPRPGAIASTSFNAANQMLGFNAGSMTYDNNGNMTTMVNNCGATTYTWDARNRLIGISGYNTDCTLLTASFAYDALGRRIQKTINGKTIQYLYDGKDIVQELVNSVPTVNYIRTMNIDEPVARISTGKLRYYQLDALGSVIGLTDESGHEVTQYAYDAFGQVAISGEASDNPFQYTGRENDGTGLYYYRARYYSPELQRFVSEDPLRLIGGINFFLYVENNPVKYRDPEGLEATNGDWSWECGCKAPSTRDQQAYRLWCYRCANEATNACAQSPDPILCIRKRNTILPACGTFGVPVPWKITIKKGEQAE